MGRARRACKNCGVEIIVLGCTFVTDSKVKAMLTVYLAGLAGLPRKGDVESPHWTGIVAVGLIVIPLATLQADRIGAVPPQTPQPRRIIYTRQT